LPGSQQVNELEVNKFNVIFLDKVEDIFGRSHIKHSFVLARDFRQN